MLAIITINYNNAKGLERTLVSVEWQSCHNFMHVIVDGGSTDGSKEKIKAYAERVGEKDNGCVVCWISEPDGGIYNAMNKGIKMAMEMMSADEKNYIHILNSGDCLAFDDVVENMLGVLHAENIRRNNQVMVLIGNIVNVIDSASSYIEKRRNTKKLTINVVEPTLYDFYSGTIPHDAAYICMDVFRRYGFYDEQWNICSDWKLFFHAMVVGNEMNGEKVEPLPVGNVLKVNIDVVLFDMGGVSNQYPMKLMEEKRLEIERCVPAFILKDYDKYSDDVRMMSRLHRHKWAYGMVWLLERSLFKLEKLQQR